MYLSSIQKTVLNGLAALLITRLPSNAAAMPITHLYKRDELSMGAKAGLGIGIAVAVILLIIVIIFFIIHLRRSSHNAAINRERAILAGEKNTDGSDKIDKFAPAPPPAALRRNKSVKDRLMGPLYRGSTIDLMPLPRPAFAGGNRASQAGSMNWEAGDRSSTISKPWNTGESSPRPSFSSKRATRMMMMM